MTLYIPYMICIIECKSEHPRWDLVRDSLWSDLMLLITSCVMGCHYVRVRTNIMSTVCQFLLLVYIWGIVSQEQTSRAGTSNYFPEILWATFLFDIENITWSISFILPGLMTMDSHDLFIHILQITSQTPSYICPCACGLILGYIVKTDWLKKNNTHIVHNSLDIFCLAY